MVPWHWLTWIFLFFFAVLGLELRPTHLKPLHQPFFVKGFLQDWVSQTVCLGWLQTVILLISASPVAQMTGVSQQHPDFFFFFS
jgi:hypothetical protein